MAASVSLPLSLNLKDDKYVVILRGPQHSGKSTLAASLFREAGPDVSVVVSADDHFTSFDPERKAQVYNFRAEDLSAAHSDCFARFTGALKAKKRLVIVDNVNAEPAHFMKYVAAAEKTAPPYRVLFVEFHCQDVKLLQSREKTQTPRHSVPDYVIERSIAQLAQGARPEGVMVVDCNLGEDVQAVSTKRRCVTLAETQPEPR